jgi:integrase
VSQRIAEEIKVKVEHLLAATTSGYAIDSDTAQWVTKIGADLADKLAAVDLIPKRASAQLKPFLDSLIAERTDIKPNTRRNLQAARDRLVEFFGPEKNLRDINAGDADAWALWLRAKYAKGTTGRTVKRARQFFRAALRKKILGENPFADVKAPSQVNEARKHFVLREDAQKVLDACPDAEWRLIFALSRYAGLRCPSEHLSLKWNDIDWERGRMLIHSPKKEHLDCGGDRWVPIFPELRPYLEESFELAEPGTLYVVNRYRNANANLRTQLLRIIRRAGLKPWPKLFQNLRATRETELAAQYPMHVVCAWIGNTELIAAKHYLQVTEADFEQATIGAANSDAQTVQKPMQQAAAPARTDSQEWAQTRRVCGVALVDAGGCERVHNEPVPPRGLEPLSSG